MKSTWSLLLIAGAIVGVLFFLSTTGKQPPAIPDDAAHRTVAAQEECLRCHAPGMQAPLKAAHPPKEQCLICHKTGKH